MMIENPSMFETDIQRIKKEARRDECPSFLFNKENPPLNKESPQFIVP